MVAVDAMGGDYAPKAIVEGAVKAARNGVSLILFGDQDQILPILQEAAPLDWQILPITIEHCFQVIAMDEEPGRAVIRKKDSSLVRAVQAVVAGRAHGVLSAGNSGAVLVASTLFMGRVSGLLRPAVGGFLPTPKGPLFCLDLGANVDCKPEYLAQFAIMGHEYVRLFGQIESPRIALLSNGHEPYKGTSVVKKAYADIAAQSGLNFIGNIEARDLFDGRADVLVCDGFSGNVLLKSIQGTAQAVSTWLKQEASNSWMSSLLLWLNRGLFKRVKDKTDYSRVGGALLLGVSSPVVLAHGCSNASAIEQALYFTQRMIENKRITHFNERLRVALAKQDNSVGSVDIPNQSNWSGQARD